MRKLTTVIIIITATLLLGGTAFFLTQKGSLDTKETHPPSMDLEGTITELEDGWSLYENKNLGFQLEYPSQTLKFLFEEGPSPIGGLPNGKGVFFAQNREIYGQLSVFASPFPFSTLEEWLAWKEKQIGYEVYLENEIEIDGQRALVIFIPQEAGGHIQPLETRERTTVFLKEGKLYTIGTRLSSEEAQRIWGSFRFLEI